MRIVNLEQCWVRYLKAEELMAQGHWPEAHRLYDDVLSHLPGHISLALEHQGTKPCQFACLLGGLRDTSIANSEILNKQGAHQEAFQVLNQTYAFLQFLQLEQHELVERVRSVLSKQVEELYSHMAAFCRAQRNAQWMLEFNHVTRAHQKFSYLHSFGGSEPGSPLLYN